MKKPLAVIAMLLLVNTVFAQKPIVTLQSTVKGNQEQPKVLYIMPWQKADRVQLNYQPMQGIVSDVFSNIDRDEFLREVRFKKQLSGSGSQNNP